MRTLATYVSAGSLVIFILYIIVMYGIGLSFPGYGLFHDDGIYLVTAKSLAEGTGYRIVSLPSPISQNKYPPVFPVLLAAVWKIFPHFPQNMLALKFVPLLSMLCWLWLTYILLRPISKSPVMCRYLMLFTAASPAVVYFTVTLLSEMTFACLLSGALLLLTRLHEEETPRTGAVLYASVLTSAAILTRMAALPLAFAGALPLLLRRKTRQALVYLLATGAMLIPWFVWASHANPPPNSLEAYYSGLTYGSWSLLANFTWHQRLTVVLQNLLTMLLSPGFLMGLRLSGWELAPALLLAFFTAYGLLLYLANGITPLNVFIISYAALIALWVFPPDRFMIPLLPFLLFFCCMALGHFFGTVVKFRSGFRVVRICFVLVLALFLASGLLPQARKTMQHDEWNQIASLSRWITGNVPKDAILEGNLDPTWYLSTSHKSVRPFLARPFEVFYSSNPQNPVGTYSEFIQNLLRERADYLMRTPDKNYGEGKYLNGLIDRLASDYPEAVTLQMQGEDHDYRIYRIDCVKLASDSGNNSNLSSTPPPTF